MRFHIYKVSIAFPINFRIGIYPDLVHFIAVDVKLWDLTLIILLIIKFNDLTYVDEFSASYDFFPNAVLYKLAITSTVLTMLHCSSNFVCLIKDAMGIY